MSMKKLQQHKLIEWMPPLTDEEFEGLKQSIAEVGLIDPIVLLEGKVLDGWHRYKACAELKVEPKTEDYRSDNPIGFVVARLARRNLDESQRAMVGTRLAALGEGRPAKVKNAQICAVNPPTQEEAAKLMGVGRRLIQKARKVVDRGTPELVDAVDRGKIKLEAAEPISALPKTAQKKIVAAEPQKRKQLIAVAKKQVTKQRKQERAQTPPPAIEKKPSILSFSLESWKALSNSSRESVIAEGFAAKAHMNDQPSDAIEWARRSLNTVTGCLHDCPYCYARDIATSARMSSIYPQGFAPTFHPARLSAPANEKLPPEAKSDPAFRNVFANSMSDLFGRWVPEEWIESTIEMARRNPQWNFLTLTKFPQRAAEFGFPDNWWMGTTVDAQARVANAEKAFEKIKCKTKWLSVEPLLQPLKFDNIGLFQWLVIGGASASNKTPAWVPPLDWVLELHAQAREAGLRVYYKTNCGMYDSLRVREFPWTDIEDRELPKAFRYLKGM